MKKQLAGSIQSAKESLDKALEALDDIPDLNIRSVSYTAHKLKNYLTVMTAGTDLLAVTLAGRLDPQLHSYIEGLQYTVQLMRNVVCRLLLNANGVEPPLKLEAVDVSLIAFRAANFYRRKSEIKGTVIDTDLHSGDHIGWIDKIAFAAALDNLLSNAVKYTPRGGHVLVTTDFANEMVSCSVRDNGPGISESDGERLFQEGVKIANTPTAGESSTGYGLLVARDLVERMGGSITCASKPGEGSTFTLFVPRYDPERHGPADS